MRRGSLPSFPELLSFDAYYASSSAIVHTRSAIPAAIAGVSPSTPGNIEAVSLAFAVALKIHSLNLYDLLVVGQVGNVGNLRRVV
jgi:hypothetical protein